MRMQIGKEKAPVGEFINGKGNDATALPVVKKRYGSVLPQKDILLDDLHSAIEVAQASDQVSTQQSNRKAPTQAIDKRKGTAEGQGEEGGKSQVKRCSGCDPGQ